MSQKKTTYIKQVYQLEKKMKKKRLDGKLPIEQEEFEILLSGVPSILNGYDLMNLAIGDAIDKDVVKKHLKDHFKITDEETAIEVIQAFLNDNTQWQYEQFLGFWEDDPEIDLDELDETARIFFETCKIFAKQFYPILKEKGFAGFDCGESVRLVRECYAAGIVDAEMAEKMLQDISMCALQQFDNWEEYAISYLCGGCYFMFRNSAMRNDYANMMFQSILQAIEKLFFETRWNLWNRYAWPESKDYFPNLEEIKTYTKQDLDCIVTDRISIDMEKIGYMVKEEPSKDNLDSGWRLFAGDESQEYMDDAEHTQVFSLNIVCNYDPDILPFLDEPVGTIIVRNEDGKLVREEKERE